MASSMEVRLSKREEEIVDRLLASKSAAELASIMNISFHTVRTHVRNIYRKVGVSNRVELYSWRARLH